MFGVWGLVFWGRGFGVRVGTVGGEGLGFRVQGAGGVPGPPAGVGLGVAQGGRQPVQGSGFRVQGPGCRVQGAGFRV